MKTNIEIDEEKLATIALHFDVEICHNDSDFDLIATNTPLKIWKK